MLFNSVAFVFVFLPVALAGYYLAACAGRRAAAAWLVACSLVFYAWWSPAFVVLLVGSVAFNHACAAAIGSCAPRPARQRAVLIFAIAGNLGLLFYFKYLFPLLAFLQSLGLGADGAVGSVVLPLGISFFTFTQLGYLVDCAAGMARPGPLLDYALFVTFFPHLIAGPILHHREIMPQFADPATFRPRADNLSVGVTMFAFGLAKKVLVADALAEGANFGFAHAASATLLPAWQAALAYSLQLYFDFSGYSDMALGLALMFGVRFPLNFNSPYKAASIIDFWQRWHMSLTRFITLYLYNPVALWVARRRMARGLGVSRQASRTLGGFAGMIVLPTFYTMTLAGIWHGAGFAFLIFGLLHGAYITINHAWRLYGSGAAGRLRRIFGGAGAVAASVGLTYGAVLVAEIFFRASDVGAALSLLAGMAGAHGIRAPGPPGAPGNAPLVAALFAVVWLMPNTQQILARFAPGIGKVARGRFALLEWQPTLRWGLAIAMMLVVTVTRLVNPTTFLYFQF